MSASWRQREQAPALHTLSRGPLPRGFRPREAYGVRPACRRYRVLEVFRLGPRRRARDAILQNCALAGASDLHQWPADWQSAIQPINNLRYANQIPNWSSALRFIGSSDEARQQDAD